ncbi:MAG: winged helix-turn-helix domain-containing protein [Proteobacteria bacterium]|nr:winged helix-turn-helix domain-containing protein [Pseudomonadota bacterium]
MLNVSLLGTASFVVDKAVVKSDLGPAGRLLACYLFEFPGKVHRRERLADLFWQDTDPERARSALNTAIWRIRKVLDQGSDGASRHLLTVGNDVILEPSSDICVDTHELERACKRALAGCSGGTISPGDVSDISRTVENYGGPFLDGYDDDWVLQERERLHCLFIRSTFELMRVAASQGYYERALDFGRRLLAVDPLRESIQQDMMLLLLLNGQRVEAIRTYQRLVEKLRSELDIGPMPETVRLHSDILSGEVFGRLQDYLVAHFGTQKAMTF